MLNNLLDYIPDGVFTVDAEWRVTFFNRAAEQITGIKRAEAVGRRCCDVFRATIRVLPQVCGGLDAVITAFRGGDTAAAGVRDARLLRAALGRWPAGRRVPSRCQWQGPQNPRRLCMRQENGD